MISPAQPATLSRARAMRRASAAEIMQTEIGSFFIIGAGVAFLSRGPGPLRPGTAFCLQSEPFRPDAEKTKPSTHFFIVTTCPRLLCNVPMRSSDLPGFLATTRAAKKILAVELGFLGDTVHLVPALWEIKRHYPAAV